MDQLAANQARFTFSVAGLDGDLRVIGFDGSEGISRLFEFDLELASEDDDIAFDAVMGMRALLTIEGREGTRSINGVVSRFELVGGSHRFTHYRATLVPYLWFFRHRQGCRIFQDLRVDQIIEMILTEAGVPGDEFRFLLHVNHPKRDYCVQYRESELDFIRRLMEEEGIFFYFEHREDRHTLVMADSQVAHLPVAEPSVIAYRPETNALADEEYIRALRYSEEIKPGRVTLRCFDFRKPNLDLEVQADAGASDKEKPLEVYDFPGEYDKEGVGEFLARVRLQEHRTPSITVSGASDCTRLVAGYLFDLTRHPRNDFNRRYLITHVEHSAKQPQVLEEIGATPETSYANRFQGVPAEAHYRPPRVTRRPTVEGSQTAFVVGPPGEEIYVDEYGRVKVQFHWDREGQWNEQSSCWIRVSQNIAGKGWGAMIIPRIGQEVIVDFLEGDPDRPIITGRVYNGHSMPPFNLPGQAAVSGMKSDTLKGNGYNEISFNDTAGSELLNIHAQYDAKTTIGHDRNETVGNDQTAAIANNKTESVGVNATEQVGANASETVGANKVIDVGANLALKAGSSITLKCGASSISMTAGGIVTISGTLVTMAGAISANVAAPLTTVTGAAMLTTVGGLNLINGGNVIVKGGKIKLN